MDDRARLSVVAPAADASSRPSLRSLVLTWLGAVLAVSFAMWWVGSSFYDRFHVLSTDRPSWDPWSALELPSTHVVYDPASGQTVWVGDRIATWSMSEGGTRWAK